MRDRCSESYGGRLAARARAMRAPLGLLLGVMVVTAGSAAALRARTEGTLVKTDTAEIVLPKPELHGRMSLEEALATRRSVREFRERALAPRELSQLLWAAQGTTGPGGARTAPSAGALYPLELYVALPGGVYHYEPAGHRLVRRSEADPRAALHRATLGQESVLEAPAVFVLTAVEARTRVKYRGRATRYVQLEAGHAAQNLELEATALGLGGATVGAFDDAGVREALALPAGESPLYLIPVGEPR